MSGQGSLLEPAKLEVVPPVESASAPVDRLKPSQRVARQNAVKPAGAPRAHQHRFVKRAGDSGALISVCACGEVQG
jgi:hypothetical protein